MSRIAIRRKRAAIFFAVLAVLGLLMRLLAPAGSVASDLGLIFLVAWFPVLMHFGHYYQSKLRPRVEAPPESREAPRAASTNSNPYQDGASRWAFAVEWLTAKRAAVSGLLIILSGASLLVALLCAPVAFSDITHRTVYQVGYVGPLEQRVGMRRSSAGAREVGYGIGWHQGSSQGLETYLLFSRLLELSEEEVRKIGAAGSPYKVGIHDGRIVTIVGDNGDGIPYEEYAARATRQRNNWLAAAVILLVLAASLRLYRGEETA
jgi:hypothetical protein